ncbi:MAG: MATE family efflux transporter [Candidatus Neomarinimicrobiota bacterium]|jgi:putative MATE family efflux protein
MIQLSDHFTYKKLLQFTFPAMSMLIFTSIYGVVDGFFISNFVGKTPFAAINFIMPFLMILGGMGFMFGTGGSALIAKTIGEGKKEKANEIFSLIVFTATITAFILTALGFIFIRPLASALGAEGQFLEDSVLYGKIVMLALPAVLLHFVFESLFSTAEKPKVGLYITIATGLTNIILDVLFILVFHWGLVGAAVATALSQLLGGVIPLIYFTRKNSSLLQLTKPKFDGKAIYKTCSNGSSELVSNISMSTVAMLYNVQLLKYAGENGVAAYGVLMHINFIFLAMFIGYSLGSAPVISYHFGAKNYNELRGLIKKSFIIIGGFALSMFIAAQILAKPLSILFVGYDPILMNMTQKAFLIYSFSFLLAGFSIFGSSFFTAMNDGLTSASISFLRTLVFQVAAVMLLPLIWGLNGIWISIVVAEFMALVVTLLFFIAKRKKYHY